MSKFNIFNENDWELTDEADIIFKKWGITDEEKMWMEDAEKAKSIGDEFTYNMLCIWLYISVNKRAGKMNDGLCSIENAGPG